MGHPRGKNRAPGLRRAVIAFAMLILLMTSARAQGPQFDVGSPPGAAGGASVVGQPVGAAGFPDFETPSSAPVSGGAGRARSHIPVASQAIPGVPVFRVPGVQSSITQSAQPAQTPQYGELSLPPEMETYGPEDGMTLDTAIELLVQQNIDLLAARMEIPMAEADVLTANLRANPIFYADTQLIPYGHFSFLRPGGPAQTDINFNYPLDVSFKRLARTQSARAARKVTEAQLQDAIRNQIDNLYTVYEDDVAAGLTVKFSDVFSRGIRQLYARSEELLKAGQIKPSDLLAVKTKLHQADLQLLEAKAAKIKANRALAVLLNLPLTDAAYIEKLDVFDHFAKFQPLPSSREDLVEKALGVRPDLAVIRLGLTRAQADLRLARANGYPDVYVLYQPYTYQNNTYLGVPSATSWTLGVTATVPLYNRNQGNVTRAKINIDQTGLQITSTSRGVIQNVLDAAQELEQSLIAVTRFRQEIIPAATDVRDSAYRRWQGGEIAMPDFLDAQSDFNDMVRQYRDALMRHRRAILDLNTAVGERVLP
jgi:cobalt-zinc-cadmium efflux system outer membrane protein